MCDIDIEQLENPLICMETWERVRNNIQQVSHCLHVINKFCNLSEPMTYNETNFIIDNFISVKTNEK